MMSDNNPTEEGLLEFIDREFNAPPVNLATIAKEYGLSVFLGVLPPNIAGSIRAVDSEYVIKINRFEDKGRQRFTLAHEIAHYVLHRDIIAERPQGIVDNILFRSGLPLRVEAAANTLATKILMPYRLLRPACFRLNCNMGGRAKPHEIDDLAAMFHVTSAIMGIRLNDSGILSERGNEAEGSIYPFRRWRHGPGSSKVRL